MTRKFLLVALAVAALLGLSVLALRLASEAASGRVFESSEGFAQFDLPIKETDRLFDIGIVDANGDGWLDIYTSNHHFRQVLLLADGKGGYRDVLSDWGLDQSRFAMAELSFIAPEPDKPGIYAYWLGTAFVIRAHRINELGAWRGSMRVFDPVEIVGRKGFKAEKREAKAGSVTETTIDFSAEGDGALVLRPDGQGLPLDFTFSGDVQSANIFVGMGKVPPNALTFSLAMRDRHAHAWADFDGDGMMDVFINRGALSGTLRAYPLEVASGIRDELLLSRGAGAFEERAVQVGIEKKGCSGRHAQWVDFDGDGLLDLFVNCYDRENFAGDYPKQLYRQGPIGRLRDVAEEVGLGLPDQQMANLAWFDVDQDGDIDLVAFQDEGLFLYRNDGGRFAQEELVRRQSKEARRIGQTGGNFWFYDGKFAIADHDGDGDVDIFSSSKRGNIFLRNEKGTLVPVALSSVGLPAASMSASWVDCDNDGLPDLHLVPQGLYRQRPDHTFEESGILTLHPGRYEAAVANWFDIDNDGRLDLIIALDERADFRRWWELGKTTKKRNRWDVTAMRNVGKAGNWLQIELIGGAGNRQGIGALVAVTSGGIKQAQVMGSSEGSFFSQGHYRLYFGLGSQTKAESIKVRWPDGQEQEMRDVDAGQRVTIERHKGQTAAPPTQESKHGPNQ